MIIYPIDDKKEELEKAIIAITSNGHHLHDSWKGWGWKGKVAKFNDEGHKKCKSTCYETELPYWEIEWAVRMMKKSEGGIITDLMFRTTPSGEVIPPGGLLVAMHALGYGVPVVICTNAGEFPDHHHGKELSWIYDGYIKHAMIRGTLPLGWVENKDWDAAVKLLEKLHAQKNGGD